jgi:hypothetical protein
MAVSTSRLAFSDCFELLERAINDAKGIRIKFATFDDAFAFRLRIHKARQMDRVENKELYEEGHKLYGRSVYDQLTCKIRNFDGGSWLRIERLDAIEHYVESLSEEPEEAELPLRPPLVQETAMIKNIKSGQEEIHLVLPIRLKRRI